MNYIISMNSKEKGADKMKTIKAETWKGNNGNTEQFYRCPCCGAEYRLSAMDEPQTGEILCGDDGFGGIENGCGKMFIVQASSPYNA